jgi:hypothetical protein
MMLKLMCACSALAFAGYVAFLFHAGLHLR